MRWAVFVSDGLGVYGVKKLVALIPSRLAMSSYTNLENFVPLFEVAIVKQPTKKETEEGTGVEELLFGPTAVLARDAQTAAIAAVTGADAPKNLDMTRAQVLVRPFA